MTDLNFNERLILSLIRQHSALPKADLARLTGLSPTTVGYVIERLEAGHLVRRGKPRRGRVGQPSVPYMLEPEGAFAFGLYVGRRSSELVLLDATLATRSRAELAYPFPVPHQIEKFATSHIRRMLPKASKSKRLAGLGVAMPSEMWSWGEVMGASITDLLTWRDYDFTEVLGRRLEITVHVTNDATAACAAQFALDPKLGLGNDAVANYLSFVHFFVGWFIGGGIVLEGRVFEGARGNAGALGSMPIHTMGGRRGSGPEQLIRSASLFCLERDLIAEGGCCDVLWSDEQDWSGLGKPFTDWLDTAAAGVAQAAASAVSVIDFDAVVIDGTFPGKVREQFVRQVRQHYNRLDQQGLSQFEIVAGTIGRNAPAIGAACMPILSQFAVDNAALPVRRLAK